MADLIDREDAMKIVIRTSGDYAQAFSEICRLPTIDAVPVVRCKDCIHRRTTGRPPFVVFVCSHNKGLGDNVKDDDFCSYGEKREDNHD